MYSIVLLTAMATSTAAPGFGHGLGSGGYGWYRGGYGHGCHGCYGCGGYAPYSSYAGYDGYAGYAPYSSYAGYGCGCWGGGFTPHYGCYGAGYGYHGGCYGAYGVWAANPYMYGGCFGCHGGQSGYGVPLPVPPVDTQPDAFKPIVPTKKPATAPDKEKEPEEVVVPKAKKLDDKKEDKKLPGSDEQVRVKVRIDIPEGARLFVDGQQIHATGSRLFHTPPLSPGQKYYYTFRVEIERDGQVVQELRQVIVEPGSDVAVSFPNLTRDTATAQNRD